VISIDLKCSDKIQCFTPEQDWFGSFVKFVVGQLFHNVFKVLLCAFMGTDIWKPKADWYSLCHP
jgi:hypothetical protein